RRSPRARRCGAPAAGRGWVFRVMSSLPVEGHRAGGSAARSGSGRRREVRGQRRRQRRVRGRGIIEAPAAGLHLPTTVAGGRGANGASRGSARHLPRYPEYQGADGAADHPVESSAMITVLSAVAWPYANGPRHIGHVAGFGVPSDVFSRDMRMAGHDVLMISGTDEHGTPILLAADAESVPARELANRNNRTIVEDLVALGLSYDLFTRTTTRNHYQVVQDMFVAVRDNGYMIEQLTSGAVSPSTGRTLPDR